MLASHSCTQVTWYTLYTWDGGGGSAQKWSDRRLASRAIGWREYRRATRRGRRSARSSA
jgi:hypothetical protein